MSHIGQGLNLICKRVSRVLNFPHLEGLVVRVEFEQSDSETSIKSVRRLAGRGWVRSWQASKARVLLITHTIPGEEVLQTIETACRFANYQEITGNIGFVHPMLRLLPKNGDSRSRVASPRCRIRVLR